MRWAIWESKTKPNPGSEAGEWLTPGQFLIRNSGLISKTMLYQALKNGNIPSLRIGAKKILIRSDVFDHMESSEDTLKGETQ